jgi:hypothetical protein
MLRVLASSAFSFSEYYPGHLKVVLANHGAYIVQEKNKEILFEWKYRQ